MASNSEKDDQDNVAPRFKLGDLVYTIRKGGKRGKTWLSVICPDFGSSDEFTEVRKLYQTKYARYYHIQRLGSCVDLERAWICQNKLHSINTDVPDNVDCYVPIMMFDNERQEVDVSECKKFAEKTNEERVEICKIRVETFNFFKKTVSELKEDVEKLKTEKNDLKLQMKITKESCDNVLMFATSMNDKKYKDVHENDSNKKDQNSDDEQILEETERLKNEFKILKTSQNELQKSFQDLKNLVIPQSQNKSPNEQVADHNKEKTGNAEETEFDPPAKKIRLEDQNEEIQKLNQVIKDLKNDNSKLSSENGKLSQANEDYKEAQKQNDKVVKNLKEELLKLARENADLKYGHAIQKSRF